MRFGTAIERLVDNYQYAKSKIWIRDEVAWALYHTWKEADDRKTEPNSSEKLNNCDTCRNKGFEGCEQPCLGCGCCGLYEPKDEPTTQTETQNSNLTFKTLEYCDICDHKGCEECIANALDEHCMPSQFKKQIEDECAKEYEELGLKELKELIEADRKTEPSSSEKPNNCDTCKHNKLEWYSEVCDGCSKAHSNYEPKDEPRKEQNFCGKCRYLYRDFKYGLSCYRLMDNEPCKYEERKDEPTISKMEQVETMSCQECKHWDVYKGCRERVCKYEPKDEPQDEYAKEYEELGLRKLKELRKTEPQTMLNDGTLVINVEDATKVSRVLVGDDKNRGDLYYPDDEDEPQTDCAWR